MRPRVNQTCNLSIDKAPSIATKLSMHNQFCMKPAPGRCSGHADEVFTTLHTMDTLSSKHTAFAPWNTLLSKNAIASSTMSRGVCFLRSVISCSHACSCNPGFGELPKGKGVV